MYIDASAFIVQRDLDGGDTLHREGMYAFGLKLREKMTPFHPVFVLPQGETQLRGLASVGPNETSGKEALTLYRLGPNEIINRLEISPGLYVRHPDSAKWYSNPKTTSRDQLIPVIAYCAAYEDYGRLGRLFKEVAKRGFFAQNFLRIGDNETSEKIPDPMHLNIAQFIRAGGWWTAPLYPLLLIFDTVDLVGTLLTAAPMHFRDDHLLPRLRREDDVDDSNTIINHLLAYHYKPTPISALNRYIYSVTRPPNLGNRVLKEANPVMGALAWYYRDGYGGISNPDMAELYRPLIEAHFTYINFSDYLNKLFGALIFDF